MRAVERAAASVIEMNDSLDRLLATEQRPSERLRMLRETTNQITRAANDAIQAYRRARAAVDAELAMATGAHEQAEQMRLSLVTGRAALLAALQETSHRYAWSAPWPPAAETGTETETEPDASAGRIGDGKARA